MEVGFTDSGTKMTTNTRTAFVVDEHSVFFYAGLMNEEELERGKYKIIFRFNDDGTVTLSAPDPDIHFNPIRYVVEGTVNMERKINIQIPDEDQAIEW